MFAFGHAKALPKPLLHPPQSLPAHIANRCGGLPKSAIISALINRIYQAWPKAG